MFWGQDALNGSLVDAILVNEAVFFSFPKDRGPFPLDVLGVGDCHCPLADLTIEGVVPPICISIAMCTHIDTLVEHFRRRTTA